MKPFLIGVSGGSGSGKTYFATALKQRLGPDMCDIVYQDSFYIDQSSKFDFDGGSVNFDHPEAIDFPLLAERLRRLKSGHSAAIPNYDFVSHSRLEMTTQIEPRPVILVDGILIFHAEEVRLLFDDLVYFDTPEELRFQRRLERDVRERGRTPDGVKSQFFKQVKPMHDRFVEPSKEFATTLVRDAGEFPAVLSAYLSKLKGLLPPSAL